LLLECGIFRKQELAKRYFSNTSFQTRLFAFLELGANIQQKSEKQVFVFRFF